MEKWIKKVVYNEAEMMYYNNHANKLNVKGTIKKSNKNDIIKKQWLTWYGGNLLLFCDRHCINYID